jgi:UDP-2,4-diacetamido-2,4,6-trideoxy-beta-L-altropyranose hydrolase
MAGGGRGLDVSGPRVVFLPDYGPAVGGGHVMRSLTLAAALSERGARCAFAVEGSTAGRVEAFAISDVDIWPTDPDQWPETPAVAVLDNYAATADDERTLAARGVRVAALDDIGRAHDCDLVVDPALGRTAADYPGRARVLAGPAYALVRPEFTRVQPDRHGGRVLMSLGLTDVGGITAYVLARLLLVEGWTAVDVVLGAAAESLDYVREVAAHDPRVSLEVDSRHMALLLSRADLAIGAGGSSVWERACLSLPTLLLVLADNQAALGDELAAAGAALVLDARAAGFDDVFDQALARLLTDAGLRASLGAASHVLCDGQGAGRVADAVLALASESRATGG